MSDLDHAIQLIRQGRHTEAQQMLQTFIKADPKNIQTWFWYVETCSTTEKRIQALEMCLKMNPGNPQAARALETFKAQLPAAPVQPAQTFTYQEDRPKEEPEPTQNNDYYGGHSYGSTFEPAQTSLYSEAEKKPASYQNDYGYEPYKYEAEPPRSAPPPKQQWELEYDSYVDKSKPPVSSRYSKPTKGARTYGFFNVWVTALTVQDHTAYAELLDDPRATLGHAFTWVAISSFINGLIVPVFLLAYPEFRNTADMGVFMFASIFLSPIMGVLGFAITAGIQNIFALGLGGKGYYTRTAYALAAYTAPVAILASLLMIVPIVGQCLTVPLSFYYLVLNVRALRASHSLSTLAALGVIFGPTIFLSIFVCLALVLGGINLSSS